MHLTDTLENLASILEWGILYTYNPTEILETLLGEAFQHVSVPTPGGLVCLTELPYEKAKKTFAPRKYGISLNSKWAIAAGAQRVVYVNPTDEAEFAALRDFKVSALPASLPDEITTSEYLTRWLMELAVTKPEFAKSFGLDTVFQRLHREALWMQTKGHEDESEWRLRSPNGYPNIEIIQDRKQQVEMLLRMAKNIPSTSSLIALRIPKGAILAIHVPQGRSGEARQMAQKFGLNECLINPD